MLNRYPKHVPSLRELLEDPLLSALANHQIGRAFGVSERTVRRWKATEAPISIRVALWVFSTEGLRVRHCEQATLASMLAGSRPCLGSETTHRVPPSANDQGFEDGGRRLAT